MQDNEPSASRRLTSGKLLARNTVWNLVGQGVPLIAAVFAIPLLIKGLGIERFGVLTLAWMVIGYFSLFDFGIGRALTKVVAEKLGSGHTEDIPAIAWTALFLMLVLGVVGAIVVAGCFLPQQRGYEMVAGTKLFAPVDLQSARFRRVKGKSQGVIFRHRGRVWRGDFAA